MSFFYGIGARKSDASVGRRGAFLPKCRDVARPGAGDARGEPAKRRRRPVSGEQGRDAAHAAEHEVFGFALQKLGGKQPAKADDFLKWHAHFPHG